MGLMRLMGIMGWLGLAVGGCASAATMTPIGNGVLLTPLNANRQAVTNLGTLVFSDGTRMATAATSGSTLTNIPVQQWSGNASNACTTTNLNSTAYRLTETMQLETRTMCVDAFGLYYSRSGGGVYPDSSLSILPDALRWTMTGSPRTTVSPGLWMIDDAPNVLFPPTHWTRVTINGVETTGRFAGDGSGLTNLSVKIPDGVVTNGGNFNGTLGSDSGNITNLGGMFCTGNHWANAFYGSEFGGDPDQGFTALFLGEFSGDGSRLTNVCAASLAAGATGDGSGLTNLPVTVTRFGSMLGTSNIVLDLGTNEYEAITLTNDAWVTTRNVEPMKWKVVKFLNTNNLQVHVQWPTNWSWANLVPEYIQSGKQFCLNVTSFGTNDENIVGSWTGYLSLARPLLIPGQVPEPSAYWRLDETGTNAARIDRMNSANLVVQKYWKATNELGESWIWTNAGPGIVGNAFSVPSGYSRYTYMNTALTTNLITTKPYTLTYWVNVVSNYSSETVLVDGGSQYRYKAIAIDRYFWGRHWTNSSSSQYTSCQSSYQLDFGVWYFIAQGWDGTNSWLTATAQSSYSINPRILAGTSLVNTNASVTSDFFAIGSTSAGASYSLDEVGFWRGTSLSDEQLMTIFCAGKNGQHIK